MSYVSLCSVRLPLAFALVAAVSFAAEVNGIPVSGPPAPRLAAFDEFVTGLMKKFHVPGAALAVAKEGRLVFAHGYGWADEERKQPALPRSLFRVASISKPFTAMAVLRLVEEGRLKLDTRVFPLLALGPPTDARLNQITVRQLLQHSGGWDRDKSFDPMFVPLKAAKAVGAEAPASCETVIRYMLTQPLQFEPGTAMSYSNFGYCVLGRVIEKVTGQTYEHYVQGLLQPLGITTMRIGHSLESGRAEGEVHYYTGPNASTVRSVFPNHPGQVPAPYGGFHLEAMDSHGGWIASAVDLVRFITALDGSRAPAPLKAETVRQMTASPGGRLVTEEDTWYGFGIQVRRVGKAANWWHTGSLDGTTTLLVRTADGRAWALLFNASPAQQGQLFDQMDAGMWKTADSILQYPERDLFDRF